MVSSDEKGGEGILTPVLRRAYRPPGSNKFAGALPAVSICYSRCMRLELVVGVCLLIALPATAEFERGIMLFWSGDYEQAAKKLRAPAEGGDPRAQYYLFRIYDKGSVPTPDGDQAQTRRSQAYAIPPGRRRLTDPPGQRQSGAVRGAPPVAVPRFAPHPFRTRTR